MRDYGIYLRDILDSIFEIEQFIGSMSFEEFESDDKTFSAVLRKLEIIGEATKRIPEDIKKKYPDVPWKEMAGMRDKLIHFYFGVDSRLVWRTVKERLPRLKESIDKIIDDTEG
ncbi:DUF86 domain-containing protein [Candidatus Micrarchaeota archaeon]|nr:DUF86 domain-containing protein [Candidatus Micrarchaeota archaeon]